MIPNTIQVQDYATPKLQKLLRGIRQRNPLMTRLGKGLEVDLMAHFLRKNAVPNAKGFPRRNFWARIRRATAFTGADNDTAAVTIADPAFAHKVTGGTVRPRNARNLALPLTAAAYGKTPRGGQIAALELMIRGKGKFLGVKNGDGTETLHYRLVRHATHRADSTALPPAEAVSNHLLRIVGNYLSNPR